MVEFEKRVTLRDLALDDVPHYADYWYRSPEAYLRSMGVDPRKTRPEAEARERLTQQILENEKKVASKLHILAVVLDGKAVGTLSVSELKEGLSAVLHAHFWSPETRGIGLGTYTYPRAAKIFMDRFQLAEIIFKTPSKNLAANRIKDKLGLMCVGEELVSYDFMLPNEMAKIYRLTREDLSRILAR